MDNASHPARPTPPPTVVQQTTVVNVGSHKSVGGAVALAFFFGPLGMIYATGVGAIVMFVINVIVLFGTAGVGLLLTIPIGMIWAGSAASSHNKSLGVAAQAIAHAPAQVPAAWYPDPAGGPRRRYWDGHRWTEHFSDIAVQVPQAQPAIASTSTSGDAGAVPCSACGSEIAAAHRFCPECGRQR